VKTAQLIDLCGRWCTAAPARFLAKID